MKNQRATIRTLVLASSLLVLAGCQTPDEKVQGFVDKASALVESGDYKAAHIEYSNALQINPQHIDGLFGVTEVFEKQKEWKKVYQYLQRVLELDPDHVDALHKMARLELASGQLETALLRTQRLRRLDPESARTYGLSSWLEFRYDQPELARAAALSALELDPKSEEASLVLANLALADDQVDEALSIAEAIPVSDSSAVDMFLVNSVERTGSIDRIAEVYRKVMAKRPELTELPVALAAHYARAGEIESGRAVLLEAIANRPDDRDMENRYLAYVQRFVGHTQMQSEIDRLIGEQPQRLDLLLTKAFVLDNGTGGDDNEAQVIEILRSVADRGGDSDEGRQAKVALAANAYQRGAIEEGDGLIAEVLSGDPENQIALRIQAERWVENGDTDRGLTALRALQTDNPNAAGVALAIARAHVSAGRVDLAADQYRRAAAIEPGNTAMAMEYAQLLRGRNDLAEADAVLSANLGSIEQAGPAILSLLAEVRLARQDWVGAAAVGQQLKAIPGEFELGTQIEALALVSQNRFDEGISALQSVFDNAQDQSRPMISVVSAYLRTGRGAEALSFIESVLAKDPSNEVALLLKARTQRAVNQPEAATQTYRQVLAGNPENPGVYAEISGLIRSSGDLSGALGLIEEGIQQFPEDSLLLFRQSALLTQLDRKPEAIVVLETLLEVDPELDAATNNLAVILVEEAPWRDIPRALELTERFKRSQIPAFLDTLGWVNLHAGNTNNAVYFLEAAAKADSGDGEIRYHLSQAYLAAGQVASAKAELGRAQVDQRYADQPWFSTIKTQLESLSE